jgi:23S rRNA (cytidine1920-2'-O)/16S rRNA (cytidine1409-2'-O)-methyltransferase
MEGALKQSGLQVKGFRVLDVGLSTGGFTDCLLQHGAISVTGLDVGHNQTHHKIKSDARVTVHEGVNARAIPRELLPEPFDLVVIDVSFISLSLILPEAFKFLRPAGYLLALIKPQFEVERKDVGKGGIVKDPLLHEQVQAKILRICEGLGLLDLLIFQSPIEGTDGNKEFFIYAKKAESDR